MDSRVYETTERPSVRLSHRSTTAAMCGGFAADVLAGRRYRSIGAQCATCAAAQVVNADRLTGDKRGRGEGKEEGRSRIGRTTKPEIRNTSLRRQRMTESRPYVTCTQIGDMIADKHTPTASAAEPGGHRPSQ